MTEHEREARAAIRKLGISPAPMIELGAVISYINDGYYQRQYCEGVRDSLVSLARHVANKQFNRIRDCKIIARNGYLE
mgnify:CR=1 FL=1